MSTFLFRGSFLLFMKNKIFFSLKHFLFFRNIKQLIVFYLSFFKFSMQFFPWTFIEFVFKISKESRFQITNKLKKFVILTNFQIFFPFAPVHYFYFPGFDFVLKQLRKIEISSTNCKNNVPKSMWLIKKTSELLESLETKKSHIFFIVHMATCCGFLVLSHQYYVINIYEIQNISKL